jgi:hypothetical protein
MIECGYDRLRQSNALDFWRNQNNRKLAHLDINPPKAGSKNNFGIFIGIFSFSLSPDQELVWRH